MTTMSRIIAQGTARQNAAPQPAGGGMMFGTVVDVEDPEGLNRVQIEYPSLDGASSNGALAWAPVALPFAGDNYGAFMIPAVGERVVVSFIANDLRQPIVLGSVWHGEATSNETMGGNGIEKWAMTGRNGTRIAVVEEDAGHKIEMQTGTGVSITISDEGGGTIELTTGGSTITLSPSEISMDTATFKVNAAQFEVSAGMAKIDAPILQCSGVVTSQVCQTNTVIATTYTPGAGNIW
jgi:uncharacterized protein involved in type VI secretion and phage assembly